MGCGTSSHPPKKDTPAHSHVTVAAQQRAEAAYRRQRMAHERAEQTAIWRAEMEVERARMLKEMSGGGSRRPSYCKELEDLREEVPDEVRKQMDECLQDDSVRAKNARNSLPGNEHPRSAAITERRRSRDERVKPALRQEKARENDENGNAKRKLSTGEQIDLDFLRIIGNRSGHASPSNVNIEESEQEEDGSGCIDKTFDPSVGVADLKQLEASQETRLLASKKTENVLVTENKDEDLILHEPADGYSGGSRNDDNDQDDTSTIKKLSDENTEKDSESEQVQDGDNNTTKVTSDLNAAHNEALEAKEMAGHNVEIQGQQEIAEKQDQHDGMQTKSGLLQEKAEEQQREGEANGEHLILNKEQAQISEKEKQTFQNEKPAQQDKDEEKKDVETVENSMLNEHGLINNVESERNDVNTNNDMLYGQQDGKRLGPSDDVISG